MRKKLFLPFIFTFILLFQNINAQSPYKLSWGKESVILATGLAVAITASEVDDKVTPLTQPELDQLNKNDLNFLDRSASNYYSQDKARISDGFLFASLSSPALFLTGKASRSNFGIISCMYIETTVFAASLPSYAKGGVQRIRPYVYNDNAPLDEKLTGEAKRSFFSGHTTLAFSSAVFLSTVYSNYYPDSKYKPYVWGGSLLAAGTVGFMRYRSGAHFPTDVLVGAAVGSAVGYLIPRLHKNTNKAALTVMPYFYDHKTGVSVVWRLK